MKLSTVAAVAALPALALAAPAPNAEANTDVTVAPQERTLLLLALGALLFEGLTVGDKCSYGGWTGTYRGRCSGIPVFDNGNGLCTLTPQIPTTNVPKCKVGWGGLGAGCNWWGGWAAWKRDGIPDDEERDLAVEERDSAQPEKRTLGLLLGLLGGGAHKYQPIHVQGDGGNGWNGFGSGLYLHSSGYLNCNKAWPGYQLQFGGQSYKYAGCDNQGIQYWACNDGYARPITPCPGEQIGGSWGGDGLQCPQGWKRDSLNELD